MHLFPLLFYHKMREEKKLYFEKQFQKNGRILKRRILPNM